MSFQLALRAGNETFSGEVRETVFSGEGIELLVVFVAPLPPDMPIGERVGVSLRGTQLIAPFDTQATVVLCRKTAATYVYQFRLGLDARTALTPELNKREAIRVRPDPEQPADLRFYSAAGKLLARPFTNDISITGISALVSSDAEAELYRHWELLLSIRLSADAALDVRGQVKYRKLSGSTVFYGVHFDAAGTEDFGEKQELVRRYVMDRQREELRAGKARRRRA